MNRQRRWTAAAGMFLGSGGAAWANNLTITNVMMRGCIRLTGCRRAFLPLCAVLMLVLPAVAAGSLVVSTNAGNWNDAIWDPAPPTAGDDVVVLHNVALTNSTPSLASFTISNATANVFLTFTHWDTALNATNVTVGDKGRLTHTACTYVTSPPVTNRVWIVASNVTVAAGGSIDVTGVGYTDGGPGSVGSSRRGGSYGGRGAFYSGQTVGPVYGSGIHPVDPGSRGESENAKGPGGGVVRIEADDRVVVNGTIKADGWIGTTWHSGYGSGGSVYITCSRFAGTNGTISARGGTSSGDLTHVAGGGGGRIAVHYLSGLQQGEPQPSVVFSTAPGATGANHQNKATMGTVYLTDTQVLPDDLTAYSGWFVDITDWEAGDVSISGTTLGFASITNWSMTSLTLDAATLYVGSSAVHTQRVVTCVGNLTLTNSSALWLYSGATDSVWTNYGARVTVSNDLTVGAGCWIYPVSHPENGGSWYFSVSNLTVKATGGVDADARGFAPGYGEGRGKSNRTGGGYGGRGQNYSASNGGESYGSDVAPVDAGSPGSGESRGRGGGLIRVEAADTITVDGALLARGGAIGDYGGAGSGGGIYLRCITLAGTETGSLNATGGNAPGTYGSAGGGGRIAVYRAQDFYIGSVTATNGTGGTVYSPLAQPGSIVWSNIVVAGFHTLNVAGDPAWRGTSTPYNQGDNLVAEGESVTISVNTPADEADGVRYACIGYSLSDGEAVIQSGPQNQTTFDMDGDRWLTWRWTNEYHLATTAATNGQLVVNRTGWYTNAVQVTVQANPDGGYTFLRWTGDVPPADATANPLTLAMTQPRAVVAHFASTTPQSKTWAGTGNWYADYDNWTPAGAPGEEDTVTIASGTVTLDEPAIAGDLTVQGALTVTPGINPAVSLTAGSLTITGATATVTLDRSDLDSKGDLALRSGGSLTAHGRSVPGVPVEPGAVIRVGGHLFVGAGCWVYPVSNPQNGGSPHFTVGRLTIEGPTGGFNADQRGFTVGYGPGQATVGRTGGGYGGQGQNAHTSRGGLPYGWGDEPNWPLEPLWPGSPGRAELSGTGGGLVRIDSAGPVTVNGSITARGQACSNYQAAGSGGGIYITCTTFAGNGGVLNANGGNAGTTHASRGGGGRIAVSRIRHTFTGDVTANAGSGGDPSEYPIAATDGTVVWIDIPPAGTLIMIR